MYTFIIGTEVKSFQTEKYSYVYRNIKVKMLIKSSFSEVVNLAFQEENFFESEYSFQKILRILKCC